MLGAAIAAGASLISGLFGKEGAEDRAEEEKDAINRANKKATELTATMNKEVRARADAAALVPVQTYRAHEGQVDTKSGVDMAAFMKAAEENGFNPLTFLRSGALSLFATSRTTDSSEDWTCTTGERAMDAAVQGQHIPQLQAAIPSTQVPSTGEVFGNALTSGVNQYFADQQEARAAQLQRDIVNMQLSGANRNGSYVSRSGFVPSSRSSGLTIKQTPVANGGYNATKNWGVVPAAPFEPKTEFDDWTGSFDQLTTLFRDNFNRTRNDPWIRAGSPLDGFVRTVEGLVRNAKPSSVRPQQEPKATTAKPKLKRIGRFGGVYFQ